jgi:putative transcriptional regulator
MLSNVVKVRIRELAEKRGITTAYQLQKLTGAQPGLAAKWYRNDLKSISLDTIDLLCKKLECTPGELFAYDARK